MSAKQITVADAKGWTIGTVRTTGTGKKFLAFNKGVEITVDGRAIDLGEFNLLYFNAAAEELAHKLDNGYISDEEYQKSVEFQAEKRISQILKGKFKA